MGHFLTSDNKLDFASLMKASDKPELFCKDEVNFWVDPYISEHILYAHLDDDSDEGSRKYETIIKSVLWISEKLEMDKGAKLLDLGCGPGLYSEHFCGQGFDVTAIDFSESSIKYAKEEAEANKYEIKYLCQDYLNIDYQEEFDVITLIYGDLCVLSPKDRDILLAKINKALKPGGYLVCDVFTRKYFDKELPLKSWDICLEDGFWKEEAHMLIEEHIKYTKERTRLDKYTIIQDNGKIQTYHIWKEYFTLTRAKSLLKSHKFQSIETFSDLCGTEYKKDSKWIGLIAKK